MQVFEESRMWYIGLYCTIKKMLNVATNGIYNYIVLTQRYVTHSNEAWRLVASFMEVGHIYAWIYEASLHWDT